MEIVADKESVVTALTVRTLRCKRRTLPDPRRPDLERGTLMREEITGEVMSHAIRVLICSGM
jgi:hypothetical protein